MLFDIGASEILIIVIVAILVIGPKEMPRALRTAGQWIGKIRKVSGHFRAGIDAMIREAELEEMEKEWKDRNAKIMADHPDGEMTQLPAATNDELAGESRDGPVDLTEQTRRDDPAPPPPPDAASAEARAAKASDRVRPDPDPMAAVKPKPDAKPDNEPTLPFGSKG